MLTEARDLGEELGDTEIRAEAMAWRVPAFVALCDIDSARREVARAARDWPSRRRSRSCSTSPSTTARRSRSATGASRRPRRAARALARVEPAADRAGRLRRLRDPDVQHPPRAGAPGGARARGQDPRRRVQARRARGGRGSSRCSPSSAWRRRRGGSSRGSRPRGSTRFRESLWLASLAYLTDACAALGDEAMAALVYPELEPFAGGNVMIGHLVACYGAADRYLGMLAATLGEWERAEEHFERAMELNRRMGAVTWLAHTAYEYARLLLARGRGERDARRGAARRGGGARRADRHAGAARPHPRARVAPRRPPPCPTACRRARCRSSASSPAGLSNREIGSDAVRSASTRPPTTSAASCARPAAPTAPRPPPTRTGTAWSRREAATRYDPATMPLYMIERTFAEQLELTERRRQADRGDQRRRGRALALLVPERRPAAHLLPLRGAVAGRDPWRPRGARTSRPTRSSRSARRRSSCRAACATGPIPRPVHSA